MALLNEACFPCDCVPEETRKVRLLGIYPQRQEGLVLQRIKVPGGRIRLDQLQWLAMLARQYTPEYPLHITTRQDIELHGIRPADVPAVQNRIADLGLSCLGAAGDTVRNIVVCPRDGFCRGSWKVSGLAETIRTTIESLSWIADLPRKFKISVCGCQCCNTRPWIQDLGLVANHDGTFSAILAGSLGAKPAAGIQLFDSLRVEQVIPLVITLLKLFHAEGNRANRHRARLRHLREQLGDEVFSEQVRRLLEEEIAKRQYPLPHVSRVEADAPLQLRLSLPLGDISPEDAWDLAEAIEATGGELRLGLQHDLLVFGRTAPKLNPALADLKNNISLVACPGSTWCTRGIANSRDVAKRILRQLPADCPVSMAVGGCSNNCSQAAVADIGLLGRVKTVQGKRKEGFRIFIGGGNGRTPRLGQELYDFVPAGDAAIVVDWLLREYHRINNAGKLSFADFSSCNFERLKDRFRRRFGEEVTVCDEHGNQTRSCIAGK